MKRSMLASTLVFAVVVLLSGCGGGSGGSNVTGESWSGTDSYGVIAFTVYTDGTIAAKGTITGGSSRSGYGTYTKTNGTITGTFSTSGSCTGPFSATVSGNTMSGSYSDNCGHASGFTTTLATVRDRTWQSDGSGFLQFITSNPDYYYNGLWYHLNAAYQAQMSTVTATIKKHSGSQTSGYGIVFCYQDTNNFYNLLVDTRGHFLIREKVAGTYSTIIPWTTSGSLNTGYDITNEISVVQQSLHTFTVYFNGIQGISFSDSHFTGGSAGFYATVHDQTDEYFPGLPVDIRFKMSAPILYP